ncbi:MAG: hypothetical protein IPM79_19980 [Polyangiaceae bacterium]|nr:hypothetical protein [Polyangiaceae bacterium]
MAEDLSPSAPIERLLGLKFALSARAVDAAEFTLSWHSVPPASPAKVPKATVRTDHADDGLAEDRAPFGGELGYGGGEVMRAVQALGDVVAAIERAASASSPSALGCPLRSQRRSRMTPSVPILRSWLGSPSWC